MLPICRMRTRCEMIAIVFICSACLGLPLYGQAIYGSIYGQVTDQTGAVVPNATITVTDESKNTSTQVTSNAQGEYSAEHLIPDVYDITAAASGFQTQQTKGIQVSADTSPKVDLKLQVGSSTQ